MKISVATGGAIAALGVDAGLKAIKDAGFEAIDLGLDAFFLQKDKMDEDYLAYLMDEKRICEFFATIKETVEKYELAVEQVHAPTAYVPKKPIETEIMRPTVIKSIELCEALGCRRIVIHPIFDGSARYPSLTPEEEYSENLKYFSSIIPFLKKHHVMCCIENAYCIDWGTKKSYTTTWSDVRELNRAIDELNDIAGEKCFGACLDIGHLLILGIDPCYALEIIGDRLEVLHVHDNDGYNDDHTAPFFGVCNWNRFIKGLRAVSYQGNMNLETSSFVDLFPKELVPDSLKLLSAIASYFREQTLAERK